MYKKLMYCLVMKYYFLKIMKHPARHLLNAEKFESKSELLSTY